MFSDTAREPRDTALEPWAANLLPSAHVPRRACDHDPALDETGQLIDLHRVVTAVRHRHHHDIGSRVVDAVAERLRRALSEGVVQMASGGAPVRVRTEEGNGGVGRQVVYHQHLRGAA